MKVTVGKVEDPWCEIDLTEEDVEAGPGCAKTSFGQIF